MELSRSEYPAIVASLPPSPAVRILRDRLQRVQTLNLEIAEWLQERRRIEEAYAAGLSKLSKKQLPGEASDLGVFQVSWHRITNSAASLAASHQQFAHKIESEVERSLREFANRNQEWAGMKNMETNLASVAKSLDLAEEKAEKLKKRGTKAKPQQVAEAATAVSQAMAEWDSQAPFVFERLQAADEGRCNHLRDALTRLETLEVDQAQRNMQAAEETMNVILDINTNDEIKAFANKATLGRHKIERTSSRTATTTPGMPSSTPSIVTDDSVSVQSSGSGGGSGHGLGLKRLGTVLRGRNRNSSIPYFNRSTSPAKTSSEKIGTGRGPVPPLPPSPHASTNNLSGSRGSENNNTLGVPTSSSSTPPRPSTAGGSIDVSTTKLNGDNNSLASPVSPVSDMPRPPATAPSLTVTSDEPQTDSEGYTIPPPVHDIGGGSPTSEDITDEQIQPQFKVEIKNDVIHEEEEEADAALSKVAIKLRAQNTVSRKTRGRRDARDVRNTMYIPGPTTELTESFPSSPPLTPMKFTPRPSTVTSEAGSDTQSIRSSRSMTSLAGAQIKHPDLTEEGLSASLVESISMSFDGGQPTKTLVIGEVALAYNPQEATEQVTNEIIRMENFAVLEKVAPNPAFISSLPDKDGEYSVALANIHKTAVAFKYQIHVDESNISVFAPIIVTPAWKIEQHQSSLILNWKPNPNFRRLNDAKGPFTMRNVVFLTGTEGATASSCQSKPAGTFSRERCRLVWKIGDLTVDPESIDATAGGKLLARFATDGPARPTPVEVRWEVSGEDANTVGSGLSMSVFNNEPITTAPAAPAAEEADPFADASIETPSPLTEGFSGVWKELPTVRRVMSGKYIAV